MVRFAVSKSICVLLVVMYLNLFCCSVSGSEKVIKLVKDKRWKFVVAFNGLLYFINPPGQYKPVLEAETRKKGEIANYPTFSPDGRHVAYCLLKKSITYMFEYDLVRKELRNLYKTQLGIRNLSWSPDGKRILFLTNYNHDLETLDLCVIEFATLEVQVVAKGMVSATQVCTPSWLHDGSAILFSGRDGRIIKIDPSEHIPTVVLNGTCPSCSPDGKYIVFRDGKNTLRKKGIEAVVKTSQWSDYYIYDVRQKTKKLLFHGKGMFGLGGTVWQSVLWSPDAQYLMFFKSQDFPNVEEAFLMHVETGRRFPFAKLKPFSPGAIDWAKY